MCLPESQLCVNRSIFVSVFISTSGPSPAKFRPSRSKWILKKLLLPSISTFPHITRHLPFSKARERDVSGSCPRITHLDITAFSLLQDLTRLYYLRFHPLSRPWPWFYLKLLFHFVHLILKRILSSYHPCTPIPYTLLICNLDSPFTNGSFRCPITNMTVHRPIQWDFPILHHLYHW